MKLIMITRKVDRSEHLAGFIYNWVNKISRHVNQLIVISWQEGDASGLPGNVKVIFLPTNANKLVKVIKFAAALRHYIKDVDGIFCHQMPLYTILAAPFSKLYHKKIVSWYMHRQVDFKMKVMEKLSDVVLSASAESFRLPTKKLVLTGHGIDVNIFQPAKMEVGSKSLLTVGRISPTKDYESMIKAVDILHKSGDNFNLSIIGNIGLKDQAVYLASLKGMVDAMKLKNQVSFLGPRSNTQIPSYLQKTSIFINLSGTGSVDKAVLEAMACGCLVLTSNEAFKPILPEELMVEQNNPKQLAEKIKWLTSLDYSKINDLRLVLREIVVNNHNLDNLVKKIISQF
ncbi:MAG: glycosyltransferase family 4 protein [Patescibacteria group bacterium]|nr:glycosyltransferase family 4 protein [Patescibacteria group bacterium]